MLKNYLILLLLITSACTGVKLSSNEVKKPLSILFVVNVFPSISETFILNQITGLIDLGHEVYIYAQNKGKTPNSRLEHYGLHKKTYYSRNPNAKKKFFQDKQFDIIYCHFGPRGLIGNTLKQTHNLSGKLVTVFHGFDMSGLLKKRKDAYNNLLPELDLALPISNHWKQKLIRIGSDPAKTIVHHMGIDTNIFSYRPRTHSAEQPIRLISIARLVQKKGLEYAIKACAQLKKDYEDFQYIIVGAGPLKSSLHKLVAELEMQEHIFFLDWQSHDIVQQLLDAAHIMLAPSVTAGSGDQEGIPVALMEAMAMGLPVISTYHSGIPELIENNVTGLLVPEKDPTALADAIHQLIEHPTQWKELGKAASLFVDTHFNIGTLTQELENILYTLLHQDAP